MRKTTLRLERLEDRCVPALFSWNPSHNGAIPTPNRYFEPGNEASWFNHATNDWSTVNPSINDTIHFNAASGNMQIQGGHGRIVKNIFTETNWNADIILEGNVTLTFTHASGADSVWESGGIYSTNSASQVNFQGTTGSTLAWRGGSIATIHQPISANIEGNGMIFFINLTAAGAFGCQFNVTSGGELNILPTSGEIDFTRNDHGIYVGSGSTLTLNNSVLLDHTAATFGKIVVEGTLDRQTNSDGSSDMQIAINNGGVFNYTGDGELEILNLTGSSLLVSGGSSFYFENSDNGQIISAQPIEFINSSLFVRNSDVALPFGSFIGSTIDMTEAANQNDNFLFINGDTTIHNTAISLDIFQNTLTEIDHFAVVNGNLTITGTSVLSTTTRGNYMAGAHNHPGVSAQDGLINGNFSTVNSAFTNGKYTSALGNQSWRFYDLRPNAGAANGMVFNDQNQNGVHDVGEDGIAGVTVSLYDANMAMLVDDMVTSSDGLYSFDGITDASDYYLHIGYDSAVPAMVTSDFIVDNSSSSYPWMIDAETDTFAMDDETDINKNLGIWLDPATSSITGFVWNDLDEDGIQDEGENAFTAGTVTLWNSDTAMEVGSVNLWTTGGSYSFTGLTGGNYYIVVDHNGYLTTTMDAGADTVDSDFESNGLGYSILNDIMLDVDEWLDFDLGVFEEEI